MKKFLLLASMAVLGLSAAAQGVDPKAYDVKEGYQLTNKWLMTLGNNETGIAIDDWKALPFDTPGKATAAVMIGDKIYITCNESYYDGVDPETNLPARLLDTRCHLVELDANTGKYLRTINLTLDGQIFDGSFGSGLLAANHIGKDDFGHVWITGYVSNTYSAAEDGTAVVKPINLYQVNTETGELTLVYGFCLDEVESEGARVDHCDLIGDLTRENARCVFMACAQEIAATYTWHAEQGSEEWLPGALEDSEYIITHPDVTSPADQTTWNYTPIVRLVNDAPDYTGSFYYVDGNCTYPVLYDNEGTAVEKIYDKSLDEGWADFIPHVSINGVYQFGLNGQEFLTYAMDFPDNSKWGGHAAIVKLDEEQSLVGATPLWLAPEGGMSNIKGGGRFMQSFEVNPEYEVDGKFARDLMIYKESAGIGVYTIAEEGFGGVADLEIDNSNAPVEYFNLNGVRVDQKNLVPGLYITRQGTKANKVIVK